MHTKKTPSTKASKKPLHKINFNHDIEQWFLQHADTVVQAYLMGGSSTGQTIHNNRQAFERYQYIPKLCQDITSIDTKVSVFGKEQAMPLVLTALAVQQWFHPEGEIVTAKASAELNIPMMLSTISSMPYETVLKHSSQTRLFQLYLMGDDDVNLDLIRRAEACQADAIVLTLDMKTDGLRSEYLEKINTDASQYFSSAFQVDNFKKYTTITTNKIFNNSCALDYKRIQELQSMTKLPLWVKGILHPDDIEPLLNIGIQGIIVSNHGGRQLDHCIASLDALPDIVERNQNCASLWIDSGFRRGSDVFKALALGADMVSIGRPYIHAMHYGGCKGIIRCIEIFQQELVQIMKQTGFSTIEEIKKHGRECLRYTG